MKLYEGALVSAIIWSACDYATKEWGTQPIVRLTFPGGECLGVESPDPAHTCTNRPEIYAVKWVNTKRR